MKKKNKIAKEVVEEIPAVEVVESIPEPVEESLVVSVEAVDRDEKSQRPIDVIISLRDGTKFKYRNVQIEVYESLLKATNQDVFFKQHLNHNSREVYE